MADGAEISEGKRVKTLEQHAKAILSEVRRADMNAARARKEIEANVLDYLRTGNPEKLRIVNSCYRGSGLTYAVDWASMSRSAFQNALQTLDEIQEWAAEEKARLDRERIHGAA